MAWFDVLGGIGQGLQQGAATFQQLLATQQERADRLARDAEERRRWEATNALAQSAERRASAAETRAATQAARERALALLPFFQGAPVDDATVSAIAKEDPDVARLLFTKVDGVWTARERPADLTERMQGITSKITAQNRQRAQELVDSPDLWSKYSAAQRRSIAALGGLPENALLRPTEQLEAVIQGREQRFTSAQNMLNRATQLQIAALNREAKNDISPLEQRRLAQEYETTYSDYEKNELLKMYGYDPKVMQESYRDANGAARFAEHTAQIRAEFERQLPPEDFFAQRKTQPGSSPSLPNPRKTPSGMTPAPPVTPPTVNFPVTPLRSH